MTLEWQQNASNVLMTWDEANTYMKSLGENWRLPTRTELMHAFHDRVEGFQPENYWSSTFHQKTKSYFNGLTSMHESEIPCHVNLKYGYYNYKFKSYQCLVRMVREC